MKITDLQDEELKRYIAYLQEYGRYLSEANSKDEIEEIQRKMQEICRAEFGVEDPAKIAYDLWCYAYYPDYDYFNPQRFDITLAGGNARMEELRKDIKKLKVTVIVLIVIVVYLLMKKK